MKQLITIMLLASCMLACRQQEQEPPPGGLLLPEPDSLKEFPLAASFGPQMELKPAVDMELVLPPAGDQGKQGSCVSWALGYNLISYYERSHAGLQDYGVANGVPDPRKVYSAAFIYNYLKQGVIPYECSRGIYFRDAFHTVMQMGNCQWADFPYRPVEDGCKGGVTTASIESASRHKGYRFQRVRKSEYDFKVQVQSGFPVIIGVYTSENLYEDGKQADKKKAFIWNPARRDRKEYHAMLIVGYDRHYFKLMNSWGASWGNKGFVWIPYNKLLERTVEAYTAEKIITGRGLASSDFAVYSAINKGNDHISLTLPNTSLISFEKFSMNLRRMDTDDREVMFKIYDSTSPDNPYKGHLKEGELKQFYIEDSLVTLYPDFTSNKSRPIHVKVDIDSGRVDENIRGIDSMLQENYSYLKNKKDLTAADRKLLKEFDNWKSGYMMATGGNEDRSYWWELSVVIASVLLAWWIWRQWRKRNRNNRMNEVS